MAAAESQEAGLVVVAEMVNGEGGMEQVYRFAEELEDTIGFLREPRLSLAGQKREHLVPQWFCWKRA
jgi:hypothetical protein